MSKDRQLVEEYFDNLNRPEKQRERVGSPEGIRAWLGERQIHSAQPLAPKADA
jgi:hypothetical protein